MIVMGSQGSFVLPREMFELGELINPSRGWHISKGSKKEFIEHVP